MKPQASEFIIGQTRVLTMSEMTFFYVTNQPVPFADLDKVLDPLLDKSSMRPRHRPASLRPGLISFATTGPTQARPTCS